MNKCFFLLCMFSMVGINIHAQDKVVLKSGDTLNVVVTKNSESFIEYAYPNETVVNEKSKKDISCIIYSSGRREEFKQQSVIIPQIKDEDDWEKVIITTNIDDVEGLEKIKSLSVSSYNGSLKYAFASVEKKHEETVMRLKKKAAKQKCGIVYITSEKLGGQNNNIWVISGDAYR